MKPVVVLLLASIVAGCGLPGCSTKPNQDLPEAVGELRKLAVQARDEARSAREARTPKLAATAADRAEAAAEKAAAVLAAAAEPGEGDPQASQEARLAARDARRYARLADEERRLEGLVNGWQGRAYRSGRPAAFRASCNGLALATEQTGKTDPQSLAAPIRSSAEAAAAVARQYTGRQPLPNGQPDWPAVAADLRTVAAAPPPEIAHGLASAFLLTGKKDFALYEIENIDSTTLKTPQQKTQYHVLRGLILSTNGLPLLVGEEIEKISDLQEKEDLGYGPEMLAGLHLLLGYLAVEAKDYERADRELVRALRASPNNPVAIFLTGERLAATGDYERAAGSLEDAARGTDKEWIAKKLSRRARELRDHPEKSETLLHDDGFVREVILHYLAEAAKNSESARRLQQSITAAQSLSQKVLELLPGGGEPSRP